MPKSALPEHLNDPDEIEAAFPDDKQYGTGLFGRFYTWIHKVSKTWFCFSYRCTEWWAKWRKIPLVLFAARGKGVWRWESANGSGLELHDYGRFIINESLTVSGFYLSRIQYYCRWHFAIQWPLMISFHFYPKASDVPVPGEPRQDLDGKLWYAYWNHFDADLVYWMFVSAFVGRTWK
jgi:hypothetical protein